MKKILIASFVVLLSHNVLYGATTIPIPTPQSKCAVEPKTYYDPVSMECVESGCANPTQITKNKCTTLTDVMCFRNNHANDDKFTFCPANQMRYVCMSASKCNEGYVCSTFKSTSETTTSSDTQGQCTLNTQTTQTTKCEVYNSAVLPYKIKYPHSYTYISKEISYCTSTYSETNTCYLSGSTCKNCPDGAVVAFDRNTNPISSCYLPSGETYDDESGTFELNSNCAYSGN